jgi:predicted DsbA family dithiol-disulfide isomerase
MVFTKDNWNVAQTLTIYARLDGKIDNNFTGKLKVTAKLFVDGKEVQQKPVLQKCSVGLH